MQEAVQADFAALRRKVRAQRKREPFIDNLLVRFHSIIVMIRWTGLAPWDFEFPFPGSLTSTFLRSHLPYASALSVSVEITFQHPSTVLRVTCTIPYRGTSLIRNRCPPGPYSRPMSRVLRWSYGGGSFL